MRCELSASGHANVRATHPSTLELTTEDWLTPAGDCIIGVACTHGCAALPAELRSMAQSSATRISLELAVPLLPSVEIIGHGHPGLRWADPTSMVVRTSDHTDDQTLMIEASHAAADLPRAIVGALASGAPLRATVDADP